MTTNRIRARFTAPLPLTEAEGSYHYPCVFTISWNYASPKDMIVKPLRAHAVKLVDLDIEQRRKFSIGLAALVVEGNNVERMSASITTGLVRLACEIVAKREQRKGFVRRPDALVTSLVAKKNSIARRATKARKNNSIDYSDYLEATKKELEREIRSRVNKLKREREQKLRDKLAKGDAVFRHINMKGGEGDVTPAIRKGGVYAQGKEALSLFADFYSKPWVGRGGFDVGFGAKIARTISQYLQTQYGSLPRTGTLNSPPDDAELTKILSSLKGNKAAGHDDLSPSVLKADPEGVIRVISPLFRKIWEDGVFPEAWGLSDVSPIPKEGKPRDSVDSYRPIYLIPALCKLFSLLLTSRITRHVEAGKLLGEEHMGFRKHKGCEETAATLWQLLSTRKKQGLSTFVGYLDLSNAFPTTWRDGLFTKLFTMLGGCRPVRLAHALYQIDKARVRMGQHSSETWQNRLGVKTGDPLSPILFLVFMSELSDRLRRAGHGISFAGHFLPIFLYADDIALLAGSSEEMQRMLLVCEKWDQEYRMVFSLKKCGVVEYGAVAIDSEREWDLQGGKILEGKVYKYLGILFHQSLSGKVHTLDLVKRVKRRIGQLKHTTLSVGLSLTTARKVILACVASVIEYGSLCWMSRATVIARRKLESQWNAAIRYAANTHKYTHSMELRRLTGIDSLEDRWLMKACLMINKVFALPNTAIACIVLTQRVNDFVHERKHPWGCWLSATSEGLSRIGLDHLSLEGFKGLRSLKTTELTTLLVEALLSHRNSVWAIHARFKGNRVQRLLLSEPGGCKSVATMVATGTHSQKTFVTELACNSLPLHGVTPARFSVSPPLEGDNSCPVCGHILEDLKHFLLECPKLNRPPDWPVTIRSLLRLFATSVQALVAAAAMWRQRRSHAQLRV